jgi:hypothetical protein
MIETYLSGEMGKDEQDKIRASLSNNKELLAEIKLYEDINNSILEDEIFDFRNKITTLFTKKDTRNLEKKSQYMKYLKYPVAAAIIALISISLFQIITFRSPAEVYELFYKPYQTDLSTRTGINSTDNIQLSYILYQEGDYEVSFEILTNYLEKNQNDQAARFYYAMSAAELGKNDIAKLELLSIEENTTSPYSLHARWYLAMLYVKTNQIEEAEKYLLILADEENMYSIQAKKVLKKLRL